MTSHGYAYRPRPFPRDRARDRHRPRVRHEGDGRDGEAPHRARRPHLLLLQSQVPGEVLGRARALPEAGRGRRTAAPPAAPGTIYTCPMHPEVRQTGPGSCPICGMALEPEEVTLDQGPNEELADMTRRLWIGAALTVPVVVLDMGGHVLPIPHMLVGLDPARASPRRSCCGPAGRSSCAARSRWRAWRSTCSP